MEEKTDVQLTQVTVFTFVAPELLILASISSEPWEISNNKGKTKTIHVTNWITKTFFCRVILVAGIIILQASIFNRDRKITKYVGGYRVFHSFSATNWAGIDAPPNK